MFKNGSGTIDSSDAVLTMESVSTMVDRPSQEAWDEIRGLVADLTKQVREAFPSDLF